MATIALDARKWNDYGIGTYVRSLVEELAGLDSEHRFVLLVHADTLSALPRLGPRMQGVEVAAKSYSLSELVSVSRALHRCRADLFHAVHYTLPLWLPCPAVVTVHDLIHLRFPEFLPSGVERLPAKLYSQVMLRTSTRRARRILTPSHHTAEDLRTTLGVDPAKLRVVHNGVEPLFFEAGRNKLGLTASSERLATLGAPTPFALFVGNPKPHKNVELLVTAFAELLRQSSSDDVQQRLTAGEKALYLVLAGAQDAERDEILGLAAALDISSRVTVLGKISQDDLALLYSSARMFVYPSLYEGFGLPVVEAMATGTPVISSRASALAEVCGDAAMLVDPRSVTELVSAMQQLDADADLRADLSRRGREQAARFSWRRAAEQTLAVYDSVLEESS